MAIQGNAKFGPALSTSNELIQVPALDNAYIEFNERVILSIP
jgi:hypothetical protein